MRSRCGGGDLEALKALRAENFPWDDGRARSRRGNGRLETALKWLRENDCAWDEDTCWCAAREAATSRC